MEKLYVGNLDKSHIMKENEIGLFWYELKRTIYPVDPASGEKPEVHLIVQCYHPGEIRNRERDYAKRGFGPDQWVIDSGFHEARLLHNPELMNDPIELLIKENHERSQKK